ncbi:hypothetical protein EST38_g11939 [Candolleomyces aberdarensis]|uniref:Pheromone receptor n=1 Tax=Candolleomyces aberdarensis TaxID=2316362 RepID=A0A4Q2D6Y5_9AGAR|nr:hypothetical protein EST38_g11939 [Candolleomyces aberdarensis]
MAALHPELGPVAILACLSLLLPLPWHWRARNIATLSIIFWFFIINFIYAVDAFVWADNVKLVMPVWCDITTKLIIGASYALPASCLCVSMYLEQIASLRTAQASVMDKRRRKWFEAFMGFGIPLVFMALHVIVQGHRYDIIEGYGCRPTTYYSIVAIFLIWVPPLVLAFGSVVYSALALRHFVVRRLTFAAHLQASNSALTTSRYLRLMSMAAIQMVGAITITSYALWFTSIAMPLRPWTNWDDVHSDFLRVDQYLTRFVPPALTRPFYISWWFTPISTFIFVAFFSFGKDALDEYKKCFTWIRTKVFRRSQTSEKSKKGLGFVNLPSSDYTLPPYEAATRTTMSSLSQTIATLKVDEISEEGYKYQLRSSTSTIGQSSHTFALQLKAIGSYSDLSMVSPSTTAASESTLHGEETPKVKDRFSPLPPLPSMPSPPPSSAGSRLRPLFLMGGLQQQQQENSRRPLTYPSNEAQWWGMGAPFGHGGNQQV